MALHRICDRCGAPALANTFESTKRSVVIPAAFPSEGTTDGDFGISSIGVQVDAQDLCDTCLASAVWAFAIARLGLPRLQELSAAFNAPDAPPVMNAP